MTQDSNSTRRAFLKGGAIIAAPIAMVGAPAAAFAADETRARLARLEDEKTIRDLQGAWMRFVNRGEQGAAAQLFADPHAAPIDPELRTVAIDPAGDTEAIDVAADGRRATARFACTVETATMIPPTSTLAQMAHAQGGGYLHASRRAQLTADYVKTDKGWAIARLAIASA